MFGKAKKAKGSYGIVGLGRFGMALAIELAEAGEDLVVLDQDEEKVRALRDYTEAAYVVKALDKKTLEETGIQNCDVAVVCIGEKMDVSILTTLHLVSLGIPTVIAKAASEEQGQVLRKLGAQVVYPEHDMAIRLAHRLETTGMLDFVQLSERVSISKLEVPPKMIGRTVVDVNLRGRFGLNIIAIENSGKVNETVGPDTTFQEGDILFVSGNKNAANNLIEWLENH